MPVRMGTLQRMMRALREVPANRSNGHMDGPPKTKKAPETKKKHAAVVNAMGTIVPP